MASLVLSTRLAVHKQSFSNLLRQNGRRMTKVYLRSGCIPSLNISQLDSFNTTQCCKNKTLKLNYNFVQSFRKFSLMFSLMRNSILSQQLFVEFCLRIKKEWEDLLPLINNKLLQVINPVNPSITSVTMPPWMQHIMLWCQLCRLTRKYSNLPSTSVFLKQFPASTKRCPASCLDCKVICSWAASINALPAAAIKV